MDTETDHWKLGLVLSCVFMGALTLSIASSCSHDDGVTPPESSRAELQDEQRRLWTEHAFWMRVVILADLSGTGDLSPAEARLHGNRDDVVAAFLPYYGDAVATELSTLLHAHTELGIAVVDAARSGDEAALATASGAWYASAHRLAVFLASTNRAWRVDALDALLRAHVDEVAAQATARLHGDWDADADAYDRSVAHARELADTLSAGVATQFPTRVRADGAVTPSDRELHRSLRASWHDHAVWSHFYVTATLAGTADRDVARTRIARADAELARVTRAQLGEAAGERIATLLDGHVALLGRVGADVRAGDEIDLEAALGLWRTNGDQLADFLTSTSPDLESADLRSRMRDYLDTTSDGAAARARGDWQADIEAYDHDEERLVEIADLVSTELAAQSR